jgi:hypothetical protein
MNMKEELTKLLMESYDRGVADAKQAAVAGIKQAIILEREACAKVCEDMRPTEREFDQRFFTACTLNANAIRARSKA